MAAPHHLIILDGGMGHLLRRHGVAIEGPIGSMQRFLGVALANTTQPELVRACHREYLAAGAAIITTNSYSCVPAALELASDGGSDSSDLVAASISAAGARAREARDAFVAAASLGADAAQRVAGCVPPLHESYRADRVGSSDELAAAYAHIVAKIAPHSDLLLCETMSSAREAFAAARASVESGSGKPVWISYTLHDDASGRLRSGETIGEAVRAIDSLLIRVDDGSAAARRRGTVEAILLNCCSHASICTALPARRHALDELGAPGAAVRIGAYANGFKTVEAGAEMAGAEAEYIDLSPADYAMQARQYVELGASIVGGCCGVFPEHIAAVKETLLPQLS